MEDEKKLDMSSVEADAASAEQEAQKAKQEADLGVYTHTFKTPFQWKGRQYQTMTFDWTGLSGRDHLEIENELLMKGRTLVTPAFTGEFLAGMAARACTERDENGKRVLDGQAVETMSMADFQAITRKARGFLLRAE